MRNCDASIVPQENDAEPASAKTDASWAHTTRAAAKAAAQRLRLNHPVPDRWDSSSRPQCMEVPKE